MQPTLTVFTPTYNRAYCLDKGYKALCRQTLKDFKWVIVDDGSTDNTRQLIAEWQKECKSFEIQYIYKKNGGLASGYNVAIENADTELMVCVDSDDYLVDDAVEKIVLFWKKQGNEKYAGIIGLDCFENGEIIGDKFPGQKSINLIDLMFGKYSIKNGDRKNVVRTDLYKLVAPMKEFSGEKDFNPHYLHIKISEKYNFLILNERLCVVEYQPDGMTNTVFKQYLRSPKSFREMRLLDMSLENAPLKFLIKKTIHYISSCVLSSQPCVSTSPHKGLTIMLYPFGWTLAVYIRIYNARSDRREGS